MNPYHKIPTVYGRNPETKFRTLLEGKFATPELEYLKDVNWICEEKIDGTNIRVRWINGRVLFGGKTDEAHIPAHLLDQLQELFPPYIFQEVFSHNDACLYGEGYGHKIQSGGKYLSDKQVNFALFDVKIDDFWLKRNDVYDVARKLKINCVPLMFEKTLIEAVNYVRIGFNSEFGSFSSEGLVMRPIVELKDRSGHRIITKIKLKDFQ